VIREMNKVAIGRVVPTNREHIIALEPMEKGLVGTLLRYPYEVRSEQEYFDEIQDVKVTKDMLDLAKHIVNQRAVRACHSAWFQRVAGAHLGGGSRF
jgi:DNA end-binding protein Ku